MPRSTRRKTQKIRVKKGKSLSKRKVKVSRKKNKKGGMPPRRRALPENPSSAPPVEEPPDEETGGARGDKTKRVEGLPDELKEMKNERDAMADRMREMALQREVMADRMRQMALLQLQHEDTIAELQQQIQDLNTEKK